jgi:exopolyphosphatase/pppGpp-phosphohydrolase
MPDTPGTPDTQQAPVRAAIDIGSNTIHVVVAHCAADDLAIVADEVEMVRIGESVTATGAISPEKRDAAIATLQQYKALAEQHSASPVLVVATEAIRKASNSAEFISDVNKATGLEVQLIEGMVEATLTFYGATYEALKEPNAPAVMGVMDLGGGSTEIITARNKQITWRTSFPVGSGWLHDRYLPSNPPKPDEIEVAQTFLHTYLQGVHPDNDPPALIVTGGSANSLLLLAEARLTEQDLARCADLLQTMPAEEVAQRYQQSGGRAVILPAGLLIIQAVMQRWQLQEIRVSPHGIREGVLLAYARYGERWLQRVQEVAQGNDAKKEKKAETSFVETGHDAIMERAHKLLSLRDDVLKHDDIEAVHKMRVATRRLRAVLDAYESICEPKQFKKVYRRVKKMADVLGNARDTDVMMEGLQKRRQQVASTEQPGIDWLLNRLGAYRRQQQKVLEAYFRHVDEDTFLQQVKKCFQEKEERHGKG